MQRLSEFLKRYLSMRRGNLRFRLMLSGFMLFGLNLTNVNSIFFVVGTVILFVGMGLHIWSKGHLRQNRMITQTGPYRWVRNPFYLSNGLIDFSICLMINRIELTSVYFIIWTYVYLKTIRCEEKTLENLFKDEYLQYKFKVPCLIPYKFPLQYQEIFPGFSWKNPNILQGKEVSRTLRFASYPLLLFCISKLRKDGAYFFSYSYNFKLFALLGFIFLNWISYIMKIILKNQWKSPCFHR